MSVVTIQGVTINKMSLEQYKTLKNSGSLVNNETYVITDLDEYLDEIYHVRLNKIIKSGVDILFLNSNYHDFTEMPIDTIIMTLVGANDLTFNYIMRYTSGTYKLRMEASSSYGQDIYTGTSKSNMNLVASQYTIPTKNGYGNYSKVTFIDSNYINIIDNIIKINEAF